MKVHRGTNKRDRNGRAHIAIPLPSETRPPGPSLQCDRYEHKLTLVSRPDSITR
jgi:hypothetical protein